MFLEILLYTPLIFLAIEDSLYYEINFDISIIYAIIFAVFFSPYVVLISYLLYSLFRDSKFIGEADLIFIPIMFKISNFNVYFFVLSIFFAIIFVSLKEKKSAMMFPLLLSSLISKIIY